MYRKSAVQRTTEEQIAEKTVETEERFINQERNKKQAQQRSTKQVQEQQFQGQEYGQKKKQEHEEQQDMEQNQKWKRKQKHKLRERQAPKVQVFGNIVEVLQRLFVERVSDMPIFAQCCAWDMSTILRMKREDEGEKKKRR